MRFEVVHVGDVAGWLDLVVRLDEVGCLGCVMPTDHLTRLITDSLEKWLDRTVAVDLEDPRVATTRVVADPARAAARSPSSMQPPAAEGDMDPGPDLGELRGKRILFRVDSLWRSWDWTVEEWTALTAAGGEGLGYSLALVVSGFYAFYLNGLGHLMPAFPVPAVFVAAGGVPVSGGGLLGPEARHVEVGSGRGQGRLDPAAAPR
ncbi:hypothetical protein LWC35_03100 [Pseudonocardia kujensis]|uniref:hypothetical protein n=1 Tax=Pseudonocardia kujensis TaxID=1128675 RepID=UPI001E5E3127|nr:hypothetical protein [Pseudonocardia kujensis]MCE0761903.1 hypothetical protein [Pseudonocardia kujensis]